MKTKKSSVILALAMILTLASPLTIHGNQKQYDVIYKAAIHGTFTQESLDDGCVLISDKEVKCTIEAGSPFPQAPEIKVDNGYRLKTEYFQSSTSIVQERKVVVAKYSVLVNALNYTIRYVDGDGNDLMTPSIRTTEKGINETVYAKRITGYTVDATSKTLHVTKNNMEIVFHYTNSTTGSEATTANQATTTPVVNSNNQDEVTIDTPNEEPEANKTEDPTEVVKDQETPLAQGKENSLLPYVAGGVVMAALLIGFIWFMKKRREAIEGE